MRLNRGNASEAVLQNAGHKLFVEGEIDQIAIKNLLKNRITVEILGPSYSVACVAQALATVHPTYYFLADRDAEDDTNVERSWSSFPNPTTYNLLYWRRNELENYIIDPDYIEHSDYLCRPIDEYIAKLEEEASKRVYFDAANYVIINVRDRLRKNWIDVFSNHDAFTTKKEALNKLIQRTEFSEKVRNTQIELKKSNLTDLFERRVWDLLNGESKCRFKSGQWLQLMSGKQLLNCMVNSAYFKVKDSEGKLVDQKYKLQYVVKSVVNLDKQLLPTDFNELISLIEARLNPNY